MPSQFHIPAATKVRLDRPTITLDTELPSLRPSKAWFEGVGRRPDAAGNTVECLHLPDTLDESPSDVPVHELGALLHRRLVDSAPFRARPRGTTVQLTDEQAVLAWVRLREIVWGGLSDRQLTASHRDAVTRLFCHYVIAGKLVDAEYITDEPALLAAANTIAREFTIRVRPPDAAWERAETALTLHPSPARDRARGRI